MSRYCFVMLAGLVAAAPAAAASWADGMFDELSKDFGSVARGPVQVHAFRVVNNTKQQINISSVRVSCGCTSASVVKPLLNPGEETAVVARMDTSRFIGVKSVTIFVQFDRPTFEEVRLWVQANARNDFSVSPDGLVFGEVKRASSPSLSNTITFYGNQTRVTEVKSESNYVQASIKEVKGADGQPAYELTAKLREDVPIGKWYTDVWVKTNNPEYPQIRVPLTMDVQPGLSVSPDAVSLGQVAVNGESERRVIIRGAKPFKITGFKGSDDQLSVHDNTTDSKAVHVLTVKLKPGKAGDLNRNLRVETDLPDDNMIEFVVSAQVTPR